MYAIRNGCIFSNTLLLMCKADCHIDHQSMCFFVDEHILVEKKVMTCFNIESKSKYFYKQMKWRCQKVQEQANVAFNPPLRYVVRRKDYKQTEKLFLQSLLGEKALNFRRRGHGIAIKISNLHNKETLSPI